MLNTAFRPWLIGSWIVALGVVLTVSMSMSASHSTTVLLLAIGLAPGVVIAMLGRSAATPTVAEILNAVHTDKGQR